MGAVTSPPYDVVDEEERRLEAAGQHNVVRLILPCENGHHCRDTHAPRGLIGASPCETRGSDREARDDEARVRHEHNPDNAVRHAEQREGTPVLLAPPTARDVVAATAGERMPRKSASFGPKPRNGLVRLFDAETS
jgi:uncharacterized protein (DUF1015 family)